MFEVALEIAPRVWARLRILNVTNVTIASVLYDKDNPMEPQCLHGPDLSYPCSGWIAKKLDDHGHDHIFDPSRLSKSMNQPQLKAFTRYDSPGTDLETYSSIATALNGPPLPSLIFNGKPMKRNLPLPTTCSSLSSPSIWVIPLSPQALCARKLASPSGAGLIASTPISCSPYQQPIDSF